MRMEFVGSSLQSNWRAKSTELSCSHTMRLAKLIFSFVFISSQKKKKQNNKHSWMHEVAALTASRPLLLDWMELLTSQTTTQYKRKKNMGSSSFHWAWPSLLQFSLNTVFSLSHTHTQTKTTDRHVIVHYLLVCWERKRESWRTQISPFVCIEIGFLVLLTRRCVGTF